jgi:hypothetical protein
MTELQKAQSLYACALNYRYRRKWSLVYVARALDKKDVTQITCT